MATELYTAEPAFPAQLNGTSEVASLVAGGPSAVKNAAARGAEFTLTAGPSNLRVRVRPALEYAALSIQLDALGVPFKLLVTVVYEARLHANSKVSRLHIANDLFQGVKVLMDSRIGENEVCVFVYTEIAKGQRRAPLVEATTTILAIVLESGLASARTMLVVRSNEQIGKFVSPMFEGSNVYVGKVAGFGAHAASPDEQARMDVQTLFEGGSSAIWHNGRSQDTHIRIAGDPSLRVHVRTNRGPDGNDAFVIAEVSDPEASRTLELMAVHHARRLPLHNTMLRTAWLRHHADQIVELMQQNARFGSLEMVIFATHHSAKIADAGVWLATLRRVLRTLYDLRLTAQQENKDALVIVRAESPDGTLLEATRLLHIIDGAQSLSRREIGAPKRQRKVRRKAP